jgi:uridine kinase
VSVLLVGIAGGSGSGKTTLANGLLAALPVGQVVVIAHDAYYRDLGHLPIELRSQHNFDEPDALDNELLIAHLGDLRAGRAIACPCYDFTTHTRMGASVQVQPASVVVVEGILALAVPTLRALFDVKVFVDAREETRVTRRLRRDCEERGRTVQSVLAQLSSVTLPMHRLHVAPTRTWADIVVSGEDGSPALDVLIPQIARRMRP